MSTTFSVIVAGGSGIIVQIDGGNDISMFPHVDNMFTATIINNCGIYSGVTYIWVFEGSTDPNYVNIVSFTNSSMIYIPSYTLRPLFVYRFSVTIQFFGLVNTQNLKINVKSLALQVYLTGPTCQNPSNDLQLSGDGSIDPNDPFTALAYQWSCKLNNSHCAAGLSSYLSLQSKKIILIPSSYIKNFANYDVFYFTLTISSNYGNSTKTIPVSFLSGLVVQTTINPPKKNPRSNDGLRMAPTISKNGRDTKAKFKWKSDDNIDINLDDYPVLYIKPGDLMIPGHSYKFTLNTTQDSLWYISTIEIPVSVPPNCKSMTIDNYSGLALFTTFNFDSDCSSDSTENYPLYINIGYIDGPNNHLTVMKKHGNKADSIFPSGELVVTFAVCDNLDDCTTEKFDIVVSAKSGRSLMSDLEFITKYSQTISHIPSLINSLCLTYGQLMDIYLPTFVAGLVTFEQS